MNLKNLNNKGNISLVGIVFTMLIFSFFIISTYQTVSSYYVLKERYKLHLCNHEATREIHRYIKSQERLNQLIIALRSGEILATVFLPGVATASVEQAINLIKVMQNANMAFYNYKIMVAPHCSALNKISILKHNIYKLNGITLARDGIGRTKLKDTKWEYRIISKIKFDQAFGIKTEVKTDDSDSSYKVSEDKVDLGKLRWLFG